MVDVVYELKKFADFVAFRVVNFTQVSLAQQIALVCVGLGFFLVLLSVILFIF